MTPNMKSGSLSSEEIQDKIRHYQQHEDEATATDLIIHFESMVQMSARKLSRNRPDLYEDLFQVGQISLLRSFQQYDVELGHPFEAYAMKSLVGHMKNYLRDKSWYIQVPRRIKEKGAQVQKAIDELTMRLNRSPEVKEIAEYLELSEEETIEVLAGRDHYQVASLDVPLNQHEDSAASLGDIVAAEEDEYNLLEKRMDLEEAMMNLNEMERKIVHLVFHDGYSQRSIAEQLDISQMSVSRIQRKAITKLKRYLT